MEPRLSLLTLGVDDVARSRNSTRRWGSWRRGPATMMSPSTWPAASCLSLYSRASLLRDTGLSRRQARLLRRDAGAQRALRARGCGRPRGSRGRRRSAGEGVAQGVLGRHDRLFRRPRWTSVGGGLQPRLPLRRGGQSAAACTRSHEPRELQRPLHRRHPRRRQDHRHGRRQRGHQPAELLRHEVSAGQGLSRHPRQPDAGRQGDPGPAASTPRSPRCRPRSTSSTSSATRPRRWR